MKQFLSVFNVGQGDSFMLYPHSKCYFGRTPFLIDCGPAQAEVFRHINEDTFSIIITHSHSDHIGGLSKILKKKSIEKLYVPFYLPEAIKIHNYIKKHLNKKSGNKDIDWDKFSSGQIELIGENDKLCNHITILNPSKAPEASFQGDLKSELTIESVLEGLEVNGLKLPVQEIINYNTPILEKLENSDSRDYSEQSREYVHNFFKALFNYIRSNPYIKLNELISSFWEMKTHEACVVFIADFTGHNLGRWLFSGDADKRVFERLINKGYLINAEYLKVPHHGSEKNLDEGIIQEISPRVAIISHNNGKFGNSLDTHPNTKIITDLKKQKIIVYYTNDVIKGGASIETGTRASFVEDNLIWFN